MKLCVLVPNSYIHVSVSDLYIIRNDLPIWLQKNRQTDPENIYITHRFINVEIGWQNIIILFWKYQGRAVSLLGIHKSKPDINIGFSLGLHLQCKKCQLDRSPPAELGRTPIRADPLAFGLAGEED
jgi:hypothetical protein